MKTLLTLVLGAISVAAQAALYDLQADFSISNGNPNGAWSYGYRQGLAGPRVNFANTLSGYVDRDWWYAPGFSQFYIPSVFKQNSGTLEGLNQG